jgi:hypothetical protein
MFLILHFLMFHLDPALPDVPLDPALPDVPLDPALPLDPEDPALPDVPPPRPSDLVEVPFTPLDPEVPIEIVFKKEIFVVFNIIGFGI